jgi:FkbH-like protein
VSTSLKLGWLPQVEDWRTAFKQAGAAQTPAQSWAALMALAKHDLDVFQIGKLDRLALSLPKPDLVAASARHVKIALIGTGTLEHLAPSIRIACARRNIHAEVFVGGYNQFQNELLDKASALYAFKPDIVLFSFDARFMVKMANGDVAQAIAQLRNFWNLAASGLGAFVVQQTIMPVFPDLLGSNEYRLPASPGAFVGALNHALMDTGGDAGIALFDAARISRHSGIESWHDVQLWHSAKQEIHPNAAPHYGDHVSHLVQAKLGRSSKCIVLDLDNTLWGGIVGDDGLNGIQLGQGSAEGEAYDEFQRYILAQKARGVILAVCSKNSHQIAMEVFDKHPEMLIRAKDIASFAINWNNKADNLRRIARELNIGTDALLFLDDNPAERDFVRRELPEVAVPELPVDPAYYSQCVAQSGYLEAIIVTEDDLKRAGQYQANQERAQQLESSANIEDYLAGLDMSLEWGHVDDHSLARAVQLANKTNQFNLTTRRYTDAEMAAMAGDPSFVTVQARLKDKFGDNGIIAVAVMKIDSGVAIIDNWLMSCRVFGRQVEDAMMNLFVSEAADRGAATLRGIYKPTAKNHIVEGIYARMGFEPDESEPAPVEKTWSLAIAAYAPRATKIEVRKVT